ncbi:MAG: hypothetical protein SFV15_00040 [Polyangiaceae bacterium]|nr:hypothetical protein [Polyangiaceae bacterium]
MFECIVETMLSAGTKVLSRALESYDDATPNAVQQSVAADERFGRALRSL